MQVDLPEIIPLQYAKQTQKTCPACQASLAINTFRDKHTCVYGVELYHDFSAGIFHDYSHHTDHMCPAHGPNWVHVPTMSQKTHKDAWTNNCACGWIGPVLPANLDPHSSQSVNIHRIAWDHQDQFCSCYYKLDPTKGLSFQEKLEQERSLPFVEIPVQFVAQTAKTCLACQAYLPLLEGNHTCMYATGELEGLMYLKRPDCPTHITRTDNDGYGEYVGHIAQTNAFDHYACRACEFTTDFFHTRDENIHASRQMTMHRMLHCTCSFVDLKTWRIKHD